MRRTWVIGAKYDRKARGAFDQFGGIHFALLMREDHRSVGDACLTEKARLPNVLRALLLGRAVGEFFGPTIRAVIMGIDRLEACSNKLPVKL